MERVRGYLRDGIPEGQYRYDILTGEMLTARKRPSPPRKRRCAPPWPRPLAWRL